MNGKTNDPLFYNVNSLLLKYRKSLIIANLNKAPIDYFRDILLKHYIDILFVSEIMLDE